MKVIEKNAKLTWHSLDLEIIKQISFYLKKSFKIDFVILIKLLRFFRSNWYFWRWNIFYSLRGEHLVCCSFNKPSILCFLFLYFFILEMTMFFFNLISSLQSGKLKVVWSKSFFINTIQCQDCKRNFKWPFMQRWYNMYK